MGDLNKEKLMNLAEQLGLGKQGEHKFKEMEQMANMLKGKSEGELIEEVKKLKKTMFADKSKLKGQINALQSVRGMLNPEQQRKFDEMIQMLLKDE